tara:strand:+ start:689 stop:820 length:132 start_codon:yes stop_codon:yes gene_type:complete
MALFYIHIMVMAMILFADARGTLEPTVMEFEKKMGIYVEDEEQ